ncbi:FixH family protein [Fluviicola sp.]|jgi:nitrogen fixation protein FixH|uniref:FixH family protein n=1 Tax=Fluviicola sp. TaxID=1917219 RepID=UPI002823A781|nr:FixH family protein [Fluviicola sp.]MDR0800970.1 FixH family protein [Fluviicola sp.]
MNWGKGIIVGMVLFMGFIITMVVIMMQQKIDLVQEDYYQQELEYNKQYDAESNYLSAQKPIEIRSSADTLLLAFPADFQTGKATVQLQRPNNKELDTTFTIDVRGQVKIPVKRIEKGQFKCIISGIYRGKVYQMSQQVTL